MEDTRIQPNEESAFEDVLTEYCRAREDYPPMASAHEGFAVLLEEVDELWEQVRIKQKNHDHKSMRKEAKQIAAMAIRFMIDVCQDGE